MNKFIENIKCEKLARSTLKAKVETFVSSFPIIDKQKEKDNTFVYKITYKNKDFNLKIFSKNICNSGWSDKPEIKRIQIPALTTDYKTTKSECFLLAGLCHYIDKDLLVVWGSPGRYRNYSSIRSAYVDVYSLNSGYEKGFCKVNINRIEFIYICDKEHFKDLVDNYIKDTFVEEIIW